MDNIKENLLCPISLDILIDPISVPCCGKSFSRENLVSVFNTGHHKCPTCRHDLNNFDPRKAVKNVVIASLIEECAKTDETIADKINKQKPTSAPARPRPPHPNINNYMSSSMITPYHYLEKLQNNLPNPTNYTSTQIQTLTTTSGPSLYPTTERKRKGSKRKGSKRASSRKRDEDGCSIQ